MLRRVAGLCGMLGPVVAFACIFLAIGLSPWFSWTGNALSDLGVSDAADVFNFGLVAGGTLNLVFAVGLFSALKGRAAQRAGAAVLLLASATLVCIGIFNESFSPTHYVVSVAFFVLTPISLLVFAAALLAWPGTRTLGAFSLAMVAVAFGAWLLPRGSGVAVPEAIAALAGSAWTVVMAYRLYRPVD